MAHLATTAAPRQPLVAAGLARPFRFGGNYAGWIEASIRDERRADHAVGCFD